MKSYYNKAIYLSSLKTAWKTVFENGIRSECIQTRNEVREFQKRADQKLDKVYRALRYEKFEFAPGRGVAQKKPGKKKLRPIVIAPLENRIVHRSILNALQSCDQIQAYETIPTSFGGVKGRGVPDAIRGLYKAIKDGCQWYVRSDISDFFTCIPREQVINTVRSCIQEEQFITLLENAIKTELNNMEQLGKKAEIFPLYTVGVAQGCCLSPLIGNLLLHNFDREMNGRGIISLRYIDDFIMLGKNKDGVEKAFKCAQKMLSGLGLSIHSPEDGSGKASMGRIQDGVNFLGCDIRPDRCRPDLKARKRLFKKLDKIVSEGVNGFKNGSATYLSTLTDIHHLLRGWGQTYSFCNDKELMRDMDIEIDKKILKLGAAYRKIAGTLSDYRDKRRLQGVQLLVDCKMNKFMFGGES